MAKRIPAADFVAFLKRRLAAKDGYIFGAVGQDPKKMSDWYFSGQYGGAQLKQALYWRTHAPRVWDCNGLAEGYYKDVTGVDINARARDNYDSWCDPRGEGTIPANFRVPGAAVFKRSSYIHHVGFLTEPVDADRPGGDWYVIEARGVMTGVIRSRLSENDWNCWGLMTKYFDYGKMDAQTAAPEPETALGGRPLKRGARGEDVRKLQETLLSLDYDLSRYGADGQYGAETEAAVKRLQASQELAVDGIYGEDTHAALMALLEREEAPDEGMEDAPATRVRVTAETSAYVRSGPGTIYSIQTVARRGAVFDSPAAADNGWRCASVNGRLGWISPKMCEVIRNG